jgi:hypothetical protein
MTLECNLLYFVMGKYVSNQRFGETWGEINVIYIYIYSSAIYALIIKEK